ncbi:protein of unknown function [Micropruina glycogenica]|uniref:Uncharacterized protein n=1 Tax=Micropruina glycogenica TaxID=75385 RepID=A0A2N9JFV0_9ACTN|nr:protein of unknown function [Micropruina glycogenica]
MPVPPELCSRAALVNKVQCSNREAAMRGSLSVPVIVDAAFVVLENAGVERRDSPGGGRPVGRPAECSVPPPARHGHATRPDGDRHAARPGAATGHWLA